MSPKMVSENLWSTEKKADRSQYEEKNFFKG